MWKEEEKKNRWQSKIEWKNYLFCEREERKKNNCRRISIKVTEDFFILTSYATQSERLKLWASSAYIPIKFTACLGSIYRNTIHNFSSSSSVFERNNVPDKAMSKAVRNGKDFNFHKEVEKSGKYQVSFFSWNFF